MNLPRSVMYLIAICCLGFGLILPANPALAEDVTYPGTPLQTVFGVANSLAPSGSNTGKSASLSNNRVSVESGAMAGDVYGAININDSDAVTNNRVFINGGAINGDVFGGRASFAGGDSIASGNSVSISGGTVSGRVNGAYAQSANVPPRLRATAFSSAAAR